MHATLLTASPCLYFLQDLIKLAFLIFHWHPSLVGNFNPVKLKECLHVLFRILPWLLTETVIAMAIDYGYYFPGKFLQHCQDALAQLRIGWPGACEGWVQVFVRDGVFVTKLKQMMRKSRTELFIYAYNNSMQVDCNLFCIFLYCLRCKNKAEPFRAKPLQPVQTVLMLSYIISN